MDRMRRVSRRLFNFLAAGSLLLTLDVLVLWPLSHKQVSWVLEGIRYEPRDAYWRVDLFGYEGELFLGWAVRADERSGPAWSKSFAGLGLSKGREPWYLVQWVVTVPFPWLLAVASIPCVLWLVMRLRRHPSGFCRRCDYDLRGSPGPTCPECGAAQASTAG
jgi:hypothetical protein